VQDKSMPISTREQSALVSLGIPGEHGTGNMFYKVQAKVVSGRFTGWLCRFRTLTCRQSVSSKIWCNVAVIVQPHHFIRQPGWLSVLTGYYIRPILRAIKAVLSVYILHPVAPNKGIR
jgi:hypothetical protein